MPVRTHTDSSALFDWEMFSLNERLALQDGRMLDARREARGYARRNKLTKSNQGFSETGPWCTEFTPTWKITSCICTLGGCLRSQAAKSSQVMPGTQSLRIVALVGVIFLMSMSFSTLSPTSNIDTRWSSRELRKSCSRGARRRSVTSCPFVLSLPFPLSLRSGLARVCCTSGEGVGVVWSVSTAASDASGPKELLVETATHSRPEAGGGGGVPARGWEEKVVPTLPC